MDAIRTLLSGWTAGEPILTGGMAPWAPEGIGPCCPLPGSPSTDGSLGLFVAGRDHHGEQRIAHIEVQTKGTPRAHLHNLVLDQGPPGAFDANGVGYPFVTTLAGTPTLLFVGWLRLSGPAPFRNDIAMTTLDAQWQIESRPAIPLIPPTSLEPYGTGSCCVVAAPDGPRLLYTSFGPWHCTDEASNPSYAIRDVPLAQAHLATRQAKITVPRHGGEYAMAHPSTFTSKSGFLCAFTARGPAYRLFLAISPDGLTWQRLPSAVSIASGVLDSGMQCYPRFVHTGEGPVLIYSGDRYGRQTLLLSRWTGPPLDDVIAAALREARSLNPAKDQEMTWRTEIGNSRPSPQISPP